MHIECSPSGCNCRETVLWMRLTADIRDFVEWLPFQVKQLVSCLPTNVLHNLQGLIKVNLDMASITETQ